MMNSDEHKKLCVELWLTATSASNIARWAANEALINWTGETAASAENAAFEAALAWTRFRMECQKVPADYRPTPAPVGVRKMTVVEAKQMMYDEADSRRQEAIDKRNREKAFIAAAKKGIPPQIAGVCKPF